MIAVKLEGVTKKFDTLEVIHGINLSIDEGEFAVLVGPSGCGKSTLLRLIAGLEDVTEGIINIGNQIVNHVDPKDRKIAMVFQSYALYPHMNVFGNIGFGLRLASKPKPEINKKVREVSEILGLEDLLDRFPRQLSGGQRQRVAMGRAIVRNPFVFLFDEPLSNLDAKLRVQMRIEIKALHQRLKNTAIYVTHDQVEAMTMADRIIVLNDGNVEQVGPPLEVYDFPVNMFVAQFIGSPAMNFIHGMAKSVPNGFNFLADDNQECQLSQNIPLSNGQPIIIGIRPEHWSIDSKGFDCTIKLTEPLGREILLHGSIGQTQVCIAPGYRHEVKAGETLKLNAELENIHVFDQETGRRL